MRLNNFTNPAVIYLIANVSISGLGFLRNIYFMRSMGHGDLGQVAMLQTIIIVVGFIQFGLMNGGFRLYIGADTSECNRINNSVMTSLLGASMVILPAVSLLLYFTGFSINNVDSLTLLMGCVIGLTSLASTWMNNTLIAKSRLSLSSSINFCAAAASFALVLVPQSVSMSMVFLALLLQPLAVLVLALALHTPSRPKICVNLPLTKKIVALGFAPFCAGIVALTNFQIERWFIVSYLGAEAMGTYYLTIVYTTVFTLIPVSLLNLFYPKTVNAYEQKNKAQFSLLTRKHLLVLLGYLGGAVLMTFSLLPLVLETYLTSYRGNQDLVFLSLPGLVAYALFDNVALVLQSAKKMLNLLLFTVLALIFNILALAWSVKTGTLTLELSAMIKSASFVVAALIIATDLFIRRRALLAWD